MPAELDPAQIGAIVARNIRRARHGRKWSQRMLAIRSGHSRGQVQAYEAGDRQVTVADLVKIADALEVPPALLLAGTASGTEVPSVPLGALISIAGALQSAGSESDPDEDYGQRCRPHFSGMPSHEQR